MPRLRRTKQKKPVWQGPEVDGITQSLLSRFLVCRERFRIRVVDGLKPTDQFNHRIEYGNMWHLCEESHASNDMWNATQELLKTYALQLCQKYQVSQEQIQHWYNVCKMQFPLYVEYWAKRKERKKVEPILQEKTFCVPHTLPSGRVVKLRGKWDSVNLVGKGKNASLYLQENKTKGDVREDQIKRQLQFDLQTMFYLVALTEGTQMVRNEARICRNGFSPQMQSLASKPVKGVLYNVVRRPLSGGKGTIRQHKPTKKNPQGESTEDFYARLGGIIAEEPSHYFMRWRVEITSADMERFRRGFLDPVLEQLCCWWEWIDSNKGREDPFDDTWVYEPRGIHYRTPFGIYNALAEGGSTELDEYLATGSTLGLERTDNLFPELD